MDVWSEAPRSQPLLSSAPLGWARVAIECFRLRGAGRVACPDGLAAHTVYLWERTAGCAMRLGDRDEVAQTGEVLFLQAGVPAEWLRGSGAAFTKLTLDPALLAEVERPPTGPHLVVGGGAARGVEAAARLLVDLALRPDGAARAGEAEAAAADVLLALAGGGRRGERLTGAQLARVTGALLANFERPVPVAELAAAAGLERHRFSLAMRATVGCTPHRWVLRRRVEEAKRLLAVPGRDASIAEVAATCGFADQAHLSGVFRRLVGTTPSAWRRERLGA